MTQVNDAISQSLCRTGTARRFIGTVDCAEGVQHSTTGRRLERHWILGSASTRGGLRCVHDHPVVADLYSCCCSQDNRCRANQHGPSSGRTTSSAVNGLYMMAAANIVPQAVDTTSSRCRDVRAGQAAHYLSGPATRGSHDNLYGKATGAGRHCLPVEPIALMRPGASTPRNRIGTPFRG